MIMKKQIIFLPKPSIIDDFYVHKHDLTLRLKDWAFLDLQKTEMLRCLIITIHKLPFNANVLTWHQHLFDVINFVPSSDIMKRYKSPVWCPFKLKCGIEIDIYALTFLNKTCFLLNQHFCIFHFGESLHVINSWCLHLPAVELTMPYISLLLHILTMIVMLFII